MKEELAISQGFGIMKNLNKSTEEKTMGEDDSNTDKAKSGLSKLVCDRYPNIVAGKKMNYFIIFSHIKLIDRNSAHSSIHSHKA